MTTPALAAGTAVEFSLTLTTGEVVNGRMTVSSNAKSKLARTAISALLTAVYYGTEAQQRISPAACIAGFDRYLRLHWTNGYVTSKTSKVTYFTTPASTL